MKILAINSTIFLLLVLFLYSCRIPFEYETSEPGDIKPIIELSRSINNSTGSDKSLVKVTLKRSNGNYVELEGGKVLVNDILMSPPDWALIGNKRNCYKSTIPVLKDSMYVIKTVFPDNNFYEAWIKTPELDLINMDVPQTYKE